jgi:hypothetical protein
MALRQGRIVETAGIESAKDSHCESRGPLSLSRESDSRQDAPLSSFPLRYTIGPALATQTRRSNMMFKRRTLLVLAATTPTVALAAASAQAAPREGSKA